MHIIVSRGVYCSDQCKCGTNVIVCKNNERCGVQSDDQSKPTKLASKLSNMVRVLKNVCLNARLSICANTFKK